MSTLRVTAEPLTIHPHANADALELAQVGLYRAVVGLGAFHDGDYAIYIPEQSVLPAELIEELGLTGKLAGSAKDRVRAIRLRGELSQGIVCLPKALDGVDLAAAHEAGTDFAELLGIVKWVPPIPVHMSGDVVSAPDLLSWVDIENINRYPDIFAPGEEVVASEKIHGSCGLFTYVAETGENFVSSKGFGSKYLALAENDANLYWRAIKAYGVPEAAAQIAAELGALRVGVYGEVFGKGVQDLGYGRDGQRGVGYAVFDVRVDLGGEGVRWLDSAEMLEILGRIAPGLPVVPQLYAGPYDEALLLELATGKETVSGTEAHIREGIVVRAAKERHSDILGGRAIGKIVSGDYLVRRGGTEYE